jgi:hypothetical protein
MSCVAVVLGLSFTVFHDPAVGLAIGEGEPAAPLDRHGLLVPGRFAHIPGPNPIILPGAAGAWDDGVIEAADALRDGPTYYFYYHGTGQGKGYRLGVATASAPLGPFRKHGDRPILDLGPPGSWDDRGVACAMVVPDGPGRYWMWYSGIGASPAHAKWSIGLATAPHPLGPWQKFAGNPILKDFGYVGGVVKLGSTYHLYTAHPINSTGPDYSPIALATADSPTGPWTRYPGNPVLKEGPTGAWDHGGFSEAEMFYAGGMFHIFYGGATIHPERIRTRESIGYAFSRDGRRFQKHPQNPVAPREANPNAAAFAEVHAIYEPPFVYLYHTLRYIEPRTAADKPRFPGVENLGVQVLALSRPFRLDMPLAHLETLGPKAMTPLADAPPVNLTDVRQVSLKLTCTYGAKATERVRIHVLPSDDGVRWRTSDAQRLDADFKPAQTIRQTFRLNAKSRFIKVLLENTDASQGVSAPDIIATLGG